MNKGDLASPRKFSLDRRLVKGFVLVFAVSLFVMSGSALLVGQLTRGIIGGVISILLLAVVWIVFTRGVYVVVDRDSLFVTRIFVRGKRIRVSDVDSIHSRPILGGLVNEVYMKVREADGTLVQRGLINEPGLRREDLQELFNVIGSINPKVRMDEGIRLPLNKSSW
jgi:hypothetical protein